MSEQISHLTHLVESIMPQAISQLEDLVRIPSISWPAFDPKNVQASAERVSELVQNLGVFDRVQILRSSIGNTKQLGQPALLATKKAGEGWPTVLLYAHHDVQPPGDSELWNSQPFEPRVVNDRMYGRGAADDKAGIIVHLSAIELLTRVIPDNQLGLVLFIEGEEEFGSPSFTSFISEHKSELSADVIVVADSGNWDLSTPALTSSLRGNVTFELTISTLDHALHSGMFGGVAPDAFLVLSKLIASMYDDDGRVSIRGLETAQMEIPQYESKRFREESGVLEDVSLIGENIGSQLWLEPAITVTGVDITDVAHASNTLLPSLTARVSVRVSPMQPAQEAFEAVQQFITENTPFNAHWKITNVNLGEGYAVDVSSSSYIAYKNALEQVWGTPAVNMGVGGSIPFISDFVAAFPQAHVLVTGVEDPDSRAHSPNESLHLPSFQKGIASELVFLYDLCVETQSQE